MFTQVWQEALRAADDAVSATIAAAAGTTADEGEQMHVGGVIADDVGGTTGAHEAAVTIAGEVAGTTGADGVVGSTGGEDVS